MPSRSFGLSRPVRPPVISGSGRGQEIRDLRKDVELAFTSLEDSLDAVQTIFFGKHGSDSNSGLSFATAKLTLSSALTAASTPTPTEFSRCVVQCLDAGLYTGNFVIPAYTTVWAPHASFIPASNASPTFSLNDLSLLRAWYVSSIAGQLGAVARLVGTAGTSYVDVDRLDVAGVIGAVNLSTVAGSVLLIHNKSTLVGAGSIGYGDISNASGHMHVEAQDIYLTGAGAIAVARLGTGTTVGRVAHILESGDGVGFCSGVVILSGEVELEVDELITTTAFNVGASGSTLRMWVTDISGARVVNTAGIAEVNGHSRQLVAVAGPTAIPAPGMGVTRLVLVDTATIGAPSTVQLPATPLDDSIVVIKDSTGTADSNPITVEGNSNTINGVASVPVNTAYGSLRLAFELASGAWHVI